MDCEYCSNAKCPVPIFFNGVDAPIVAVRGNKLEVMYYMRKSFFQEKQFIEHRPINYCPECGRKLGD